MCQKRMIRWRKKLLIAVALLPLFQATACDPTAINGSIFSSLNSAVFSVFVGSVQQSLLEFFPSSEILATLFGTNRTPFFP